MRAGAAGVRGVRRRQPRQRRYRPHSQPRRTGRRAIAGDARRTRRLPILRRDDVDRVAGACAYGSGASVVTIAREIGGGALLMVALATAGGLVESARRADGRRKSARRDRDAAERRRSTSAAAIIAVGWRSICGLALMLKRAPTELLAVAARRKIRPRSRRDPTTFDLDGQRHATLAFSLSSGDEVDLDRDNVNGRSARRSRSRCAKSRATSATKSRHAKPRSKGALQTSAALAARHAAGRACADR